MLPIGHLRWLTMPDCTQLWYCHAASHESQTTAARQNIFWPIEVLLQSRMRPLASCKSRQTYYALWCCVIVCWSLWQMCYNTKCCFGWLENVPVCQRATELLVSLTKCVEAVTTKKCTDPKTKSYSTVAEGIKDKLLHSKLAAFHSVANLLQQSLLTC